MGKSNRSEIILFAKLNGLQVKADKQHIVTVFNPKNSWVDCFDNWEQAYHFFMKAVACRNNDGINYPWAK